VKYPIWEKLSPEARRAAATAKYVHGTGGGFGRTVNGCCPLGVALRHDGIPIPTRWAWMRDWATPGSVAVATALGKAPGDLDQACRFIQDWDGGKIRPTDLATLLEVGP